MFLEFFVPLAGILLLTDVFLWCAYARDGEALALQFIPGSGFYVALRDRF